MSPVQAVRSVLRHYVGFRGRARRSEFWWWALATTVLFAITATLDKALLGDGTATATATSTSVHVGAFSGPITAVAFLALLLPYLSVIWRRLHDSNRSGGWFFISFVPVVGSIVLIVLLCLDSTRGDNRFGASPKHIDAVPAPAS